MSFVFPNDMCWGLAMHDSTEDTGLNGIWTHRGECGLLEICIGISSRCKHQPKCCQNQMPPEELTIMIGGVSWECRPQQSDRSKLACSAIHQRASKAMSLSSGARFRDLKAYNVPAGKSGSIAFTEPWPSGFNFTSVRRPPPRLRIPGSNGSCA